MKNTERKKKKKRLKNQNITSLSPFILFLLKSYLSLPEMADNQSSAMKDLHLNTVAAWRH